MTKFLEGDYIGSVGGYQGIAFIDKKWHTYECGGCMRARGLINRRLQNGSHPKLAKMIRGPYEYKHNVELHNNWLKIGKPKILKGD